MLRVKPFAIAILTGAFAWSAPPAALAQGDTEMDEEQAQDDAGHEGHDHEGDDGEGESESIVEEAAVPETFDPLLDEFRALTTEIDESAGAAMAHLDEVRALRERVTKFNDQRPPSELSAAVEIQLVLWANDFGPPRDAAFTRLEGIEISNDGLRVLWAQHLKERQYKYEEAVEVLDEGDVDLAAYPVAAVIRAESLIPQNRFDEAAAALQSIPPEARVRPDLLDRMYFLRQQIEELEENWSEEQAIRDAEHAADDLPRVAIETSRGTIIVELYENEAPNTVANFIELIEQGFYSGSSFYQVVPNSFIAAGDPTIRADLVTAPTTERLPYVLPVELPSEEPANEDAPADEVPTDDEAAAEGDPQTGEELQTSDEGAEELIVPPSRSRGHFAGVLSMERSGEHIDPSSFIITLRQRADRDDRNIAFGRVIEGMTIARDITAEDQIISASVLRKRDHDYEAKKIMTPAEIVVPENAPEGNESDVGNPPVEEGADDTTSDDEVGHDADSTGDGDAGAEGDSTGGGM